MESSRVSLPSVEIQVRNTILVFDVSDGDQTRVLMRVQQTLY